MQIKIIIEYKYYSFHKKSTATVRKKEKDSFVFIFANQE